MGDSITHGYKVSETYPSRLSRALGETVWNEGIRGEWTSGGLNRVEQVIATYAPTHLLILYGTNDINSGANPRNAADRCAQIARIAREHNVVAIVGTLPPFVGVKAERNTDAQIFSTRLRNRAFDLGVPVAEIEGAFGSGAGLMQSDGFHPNDKGLQRIADTFRPHIGPPLPLAATPLEPSGIIGTRRPLFQWTPGEDATWHQVRILRDGALYRSAWTQAASWQPGEDLPFFPFTWDVITWNPSGFGLDSAVLAFRYDGPDAGPPAGPTGMTAERVGPARVRYAWDADPRASRYHLWINIAAGGHWRAEWIETPLRTGRIELELADHPFGPFHWWIMGDGLDGPGPWTDVQELHYGRLTPVSPSGDLAAAPDSMRWSDLNGTDAQWYQLRLLRAGAERWSQWFARSELGSATPDECAVALPDDLLLTSGTYEWQVRPWKPGGMGSWSELVSFTLPRRIPAAPEVLAPIGCANDNRRPTVVWTASDHAHWYRVHITRNDRPYVDVWTRSIPWTADAGFPGGEYRVWVLPWGPDGAGPWSAARQFVMAEAAPGAIEQLGPVDTVRSAEVAFQWTRDREATWYRLWARHAGGTVWHDRWHRADDQSPVVVTVSNPPAGTTEWWVRGWGPDGEGPWSGPGQITVDLLPNAD